MHLVYLHLIATFTDQGVMVEKAYQHIGSNRFAQSLKEDNNNKEEDTPKVLGKQKAEE